MTPPQHDQQRPVSQPPRRPRTDPRRRRHEDRVTEHLAVGRAAAAEDRLTASGISARPRAASAVRRRPQPMVFPHWRQLVTLAAPNVVAAGSVAAAMLTVGAFGVFSALFVLPLVIPSLLLGAMDRSRVGQGWRAAATVNLATMLVFFPLLVIRQSTVHVPYLTSDHGTMYAAITSTASVLLAMIAIALVAAWSSRQDPESSTMLFLPAAMLVPLLASAAEFANLDAALAAAGMIFALVAVLTLLSSLMPPRYTVFVGPIAVALEVLFVSLVRQDHIFPVGVAPVGMALFGLVTFAAIALVVLMPAISSWMQRVEMFRARQLREAA